MSKLFQPWIASLTYAWWSFLTPIVDRQIVPVPQPFHMTFVVTHPCNSRCIMCNLWHEKRGDELSPEQVRQIVAKNDFSSLIALTLTGGEPTLRRDLAELLEIIAHACPRLQQVTLATNGLDTRRTVNQVKACLQVIADIPSISTFAVQVSLDGIGEVHDRIRGIPGYYDRVLETLKLLKEVGQTEPRLKLKISSTVQTGNADSIMDMRPVAKALGIPIRFGALVISSDYYRNQTESQDLRFKPEQVEKTSGLFSELSKADPAANVKFYYKDTAQMIRGMPRSQTCMMGYYSFVLEHDGSVYACVNCEGRSFGNLRQKKFKEIWRGAFAKQLRQEIRSECCPGCASICYAFPTNPVQVLDVGWHRLVKRLRLNR